MIQRTYDEHAQCTEIDLVAVGRHVGMVACRTRNRYAAAAVEGDVASRAQCRSLASQRILFPVQHLNPHTWIL
jgi:hypothetical protein